MGYVLGNRSKQKLEGVNPRLVAVVERAIELSEQDFSVICGLRPIQEQEALVAEGASQTMTSKHLHGNALNSQAAFDRTS